MKRWWIICVVLALCLTARAEQFAFLKEAQSYFAHNYTYLLHELGFSYVDDDGNKIIMQGTVLNQPDCLLSIEQQEEYICQVILIFPDRNNPKELSADYKRARKYCGEEFGRPVSEQNEECFWKTDDISVLLYCHENQNVVIYYDIADNTCDETICDNDDKVRKQQIGQAIKEHRYNDVISIAESVSDDTQFCRDYGFVSIDDVIDFAQTTRSKSYNQYTTRKIRRKVLRYLAAMMIEQGNALYQDDKSKNEDAQICYQFALIILADYYVASPKQYEYVALRFGGFDQITPKRSSRYYEYEERTMKAIKGEYSIDYINSLRMLAMAYQKEGKDAKSIDAFQRLLPIMTSYLGPKGYQANKITFYQAYNMLSVSYGHVGDLKNEEVFSLKTLELSKEIYGDTNREYAISLLNIGAYYERIGDLDNAVDYTKRAIAILERKGDENGRGHLMALQNMISILAQAGKYDKAQQYGQSALSLCKKEFGNSSKEYAMTLQYIAYIFIHKNDYSEAQENIEQAVQILRGNSEWKNSSQYAMALFNLAYIFAEEKKFESALMCQQQAYQLYRRLHYPEESSQIMLALNNLGNMYSKMGQNEKAYSYFLKARDLYRSKYSKSLDFLTEQQRQTYWNTIKRKFEEDYPQFSYEYYRQRNEIAAFAYDNELFLKGLLLYSSDAVRRSIYGSGDKQLIADYEHLKQIKMEMEKSVGDAEQTQRLSQQADSLEKIVTKHSAAFRQNEELWRIDWKQVQQHLRSNEVAIEFSRIAFEDSVIYAALLLRKDSPYPQMIPLFAENEINAQADNVWQKMTPYLKGIKTIYFAASGGLHQLPIEYASYDANSTWADHYDMVRLSSTRELAIPHEEQQICSATLFGGIFYDVDIAELSAQSEDYRSLNMAVSRSMDINDSTLRAGVHYLPGTKREVEEINAILQPLQIHTKLYTASVANEESFKALSGQQQNIIHVATHGFYWSDTEAQQQHYFNRGVVAMDQMSAPTIDPLNRSGLLFAGANMALRGHSDELPENVQDGILTAKEISLLDLRNAQLVVLSACETGKGDVTGEGVFGLQRAFKQAGAQTLLMSLWPVSDAATQLLMEQFYYHRMEKKESKRDAFKHAQNVVRNKYPQPQYWAGFIMLD